MPSLRLNVVANFAGQAWGAILTLLVLPVYLHLLGAEQFGLAGFYFVLFALVSVLDLGLGATLNREMAVRNASRVPPQELRDLLLTFEFMLLPLGLAACLALWGGSTAISEAWLRPVALSRQDLVDAIGLMALALAMQWPATLYSAGLRGLERQVLLNSIIAFAHTIRHLGAVLVLVYWNADIHAFLVWQAAASLVQTGLTRAALHVALPAGQRHARPHWAELRKIAPFSSSMALVGILAFALMQADRVIVSANVSLSVFGHYSIAASLVGGLGLLVQPVVAALFPRFSSLLALGDAIKLTAIYHSGAQYVAIGISAVTSVIFWFPAEVLTLWTGSGESASHVAEALRWLALGTAFNGLMAVPYAMQLAHGWAGLALKANLVSLPFLLPAMWFATIKWGTLGAACCWLGLNIAYFLVLMPLMHRRILQGQLARWYLRDTLPPLLVAFLTGGLARVITPHEPGGWGVVMLLLTGFAALTLASAVTPVGQRLVFGSSGSGRP